MSFIVFEGLDRSGKSSLSVKFAEYLNSGSRSDNLDPHFGDFIWTKEPLFTTEEADQLNMPGYVDEYRRERLFFESRLRHQDTLAGKNVICDRYIWSGLAYAKEYSPNCFRFVKELYCSETIFLHPDLYIYVDLSPEECYKRDSENLDLDILKELYRSYRDTAEYIRSPIMYYKPIEGERESLGKFLKDFSAFIKINKIGQ